MKVRIAYNPANGTMGVFTENGTFDEGVRRIDDLVGNFIAEGVEIESRTAAEQHRHDDAHAHAHDQERTHDSA